MTEESKAIQEVAKAAGKLAELSEQAGRFIARVIGKPCAQVSEIAEDRLRFYKYVNLISIADKVDAIRVKRRAEGKELPIPPRLALPILESASIEDDDILQDVWARLVANSSDASFADRLHPGFVEVVKQMSPDEAVLLTAFRKTSTYPVIFEDSVPFNLDDPLAQFLFYSQGRPIGEPRTYEKILQQYSQFCNSLPLKRPANSRVYIDNLQRLQVVELGHDLSSHFKSGKPQPIGPAMERSEYLRLTAFGQQFIAHCISEAE